MTKDDPRTDSPGRREGPSDAERKPHGLRAAPGRLPEIFAAFLKLGLTSFGGPIAHLGYLRAEFVTKRRWLDDAAYADATRMIAKLRETHRRDVKIAQYLAALARSLELQRRDPHVK